MAEMDAEKSYYDSDGERCTFGQLVRREPEWAANRILEGEKAINRVFLLEKALREIEALPGYRQDEAFFIASSALRS